jgi:hypothetical protein
MPYLTPILVEQRVAELDNMEKALKRFAESGYKHNDIRWRHFGSWNGALYLCDLGDIEKVENDEEAAAWVAASMRELRGRMVANGENHSIIPKTTQLASSNESETVTGTPGTSSEGPSASKRKRE